MFVLKIEGSPTPKHIALKNLCFQSISIPSNQKSWSDGIRERWQSISLEKNTKLPSTLLFIIVSLIGCLVSFTTKCDLVIKDIYSMMPGMNDLMFEQSPQSFWKMK